LTDTKKTTELDEVREVFGTYAAKVSGNTSLSKSTLLRQILKVGAVCVSSARTDLCRGCQVTGIPTATIN
jgi:hypothetical protein